MLPASPFCLHRALAYLLFLLLVALESVPANHVASSVDELEDSGQQQAQQGGSWSHWWSYDGISGPDYWNINKHWRLCAAGRKQSPVNIRTERLVYDHLLGPIRLRWHQRAGRQKHDEAPASSSLASNQRTIPVKLINSGRGVEAWLERAAAGSSLIDSSSSSGGHTTQTYSNSQAKGGSSHSSEHDGGGEQLILSQGPLSYEYKFFKIELHSASPSSVRFAPSQTELEAAVSAASEPTANWSPNDVDDEQDDDHDDQKQANQQQRENNALKGTPNEDELSSQASPSSSNEIPPEALRAPKSSEHLIDGRSFEAELQLHFYNRHLASSGREALRLANEQPLASLFAVISVLISLNGANHSSQEQQQQLRGPNHESRISNNNNKSASLNDERPLDFMLDNLNRLQNQGDQLELKVARKQLEALITDKRQYVTYQGSMTRPPCAESVDWIILNRPLRLEAQKFAQLFDKMNTNQENIRPIKQLNNRLLRTTINNLRSKRSSPNGEPPGGGRAGASSGSPEKCHKANCNLATVNKTHSSLTATGNQLDMTRRHQQQLPNAQQCSMKPNYAYHFSYQFGSQT